MLDQLTLVQKNMTGLGVKMTEDIELMFAQQDLMLRHKVRYIFASIFFALKSYFQSLRDNSFVSLRFFFLS